LAIIDIFITTDKYTHAILLDDLIPRLLAITKQKNDTRIFVRGDKNIDYGQVMNVVGSINAAGFNKVALITDIPSR
jgi:biopolymer transport protein TolR